MPHAKRTPKTAAHSIHYCTLVIRAAESYAERYHKTSPSFRYAEWQSGSLKGVSSLTDSYGLLLMACLLLVFFLTLLGGFLFLILLLDARDLSGDGIDLHFGDCASGVANIERVDELPVFAL